MIACGNTHKGMVRPTNQDNYAVELFEELDTALLVVCDGMGGANAGNVASRFALDEFLIQMREGIRTDMEQTDAEDLLRVAAQSANQAVFELSIKQPEFRGMGTTLVCALVQGDHAEILNVGDSRAYRIHGDSIEQLTEDHSYVQEMVRKGTITKEESRYHPHKNLLTRAVGVDAFVDSDLFRYTLEPDDVLLLCSDGLCGMVEDDQIARIVSNADSLEEAVDDLIGCACQHGGVDNITVVLYRRGALAE